MKERKTFREVMKNAIVIAENLTEDNREKSAIRLGRLLEYKDKRERKYES